MVKSSKKSTKVDTAAAITPLPVKGKRGAEKAIEKVSAKKQKKNDGTVQAIEKLKSETKTQKKTVKKVESSSSEDESSESEEEQKVKVVKPLPKNPDTNKTVAKKKESSSDSDSSEDSSSEEDTKSKAKVIAPPAAKEESSSDSDSSDESDSEEDTKPKVVAPPAKKAESSSSEDSSSDSDDDVPQQPIQGKKVAPKADTSSDDSSSEEENDKKTAIAVNKSSAASKKKDDSSSDESSDEDSSEEEKPKVVAKVPITGSKNLAVTSKESESSEDSSDDSDEDKKKNESSDSSSESDSEDDETPAKKPASAAANGNNSKQESSTEESSEEESSEDEDEDEDEYVKLSKGQKKTDTDVEMVDAATPKTEKNTPQTPVTPQDQSGGSKTLFVGNLPWQVEQSHIENFFKEAGKVVDVRLASDREGNFKGFGHVEFEDAKAAQEALKLNGKELMKRQLKLDLARERGSYIPGNEKTPYQKSASAHGTSLFVSGIDRNCVEDEIRNVLQTHFESCGDISRVSVPTDRESGEMKGIAFVDFADNGSLSKALELGGPEYGGYTLRVSEAKPRENSAPRIQENRPGQGRGPGRGRERPGRGFDRSSGHKSDRFNKPSLATPGTGKKTTFDD